MSWFLLHFKQHIQASLHIDAELILQQYFFYSTGMSTLFFFFIDNALFRIIRAVKLLLVLFRSRTSPQM